MYLLFYLRSYSNGNNVDVFIVFRSHAEFGYRYFLNDQNVTILNVNNSKPSTRKVSFFNALSIFEVEENLSHSMFIVNLKDYFASILPCNFVPFYKRKHATICSTVLLGENTMQCKFL